MRSPYGIFIPLAIGLLACERPSSAWQLDSVVAVTESTQSIIKFANGSTLTVPVRDVAVEAQLAGSAAAPWILFSGWGCTDCDIEQQIFVVRADSAVDLKRLPSYSYPGDHFVDATDSLSFTSRLFVGSCVSGLPKLAVWLQDAKDSLRGSRKSVFLLIPRDRLIDSQFPLRPAFADSVVRAASNPECREIPGKAQHIY